MESLARVVIVEQDACVQAQIASAADALGYGTMCLASPAEFLEAITFPAQGCIVTDLALELMSPSAVQAAQRRTASALPLLYTASQPSVASVVRAVREGAVDVLERPLDMAALQSALQGAVRASRHAVPVSDVRHELRTRLATLTPRERDVLTLVKRGKTSREIAALMERSTKTIELHRTHILRKLGVRNVVDLVRDLTMIDAGVTVDPFAPDT